MDALSYLPTEIILSVVENLDDTSDVRSLSKTCSKTYHACVPALFSSVHFKTYPALEQFLQAVPRSYLRHIQSLDVSTFSSSCPHNTNALVSLLSSCSRLEKLDLKLAGCPGTQILSAFSPQSGNAFLTTLKHLSLSNCLSEQDSPVSERLAVFIASSFPNLQTLSLSRITRSSMHAQDLVYSYPCIPTVINDDDIPDHPVVGSHLNLPSLLRVASLKKLSIKDTHLGDPEWECSSLMEEEQCELDCLELGGHCLESEYENGLAAMKILNVVGKDVKKLSLATALPPPPPPSPISPPSPTSSIFSFASWDSEIPSSSAPPTPTIITEENGQNITKLHIGPYVSLESLSDTLSHFSSSPIESVSISCFNSDLEDVSKNVEDFLSLRVSRADTFYATLKHADVVVVSEAGNDGCGGMDLDETKDEDAVRELAEFCWDLGLVCRLKHGVSEDDYNDDNHDKDVHAEGRMKEWNGCTFLDL